MWHSSPPGMNIPLPPGLWPCRRFWECRRIWPLEWESFFNFDFFNLKKIKVLEIIKKFV